MAQEKITKIPEEENNSNDYIFELAHPITIHGEEVSEFKFRRPKIVDIQIANKRGKGDFEQMCLSLAANLGQIAIEDIQELDLVDFRNLLKFLPQTIIKDEETESAQTDAKEITVTLKHPIKLGDEEVTEITIRRPKYKDMIYARSGNLDELEQSFRMLHKIGGVDINVIRQLDAATDFAQIRRHIDGFLEVVQ